jgi:hypothetical protein
MKLSKKYEKKIFWRGNMTIWGSPPFHAEEDEKRVKIGMFMLETVRSIRPCPISVLSCPRAFWRLNHLQLPVPS